MSKVSRVRVVGPLELYASGFAEYLLRQGYAAGSVAQRLRLMAQVSHWLSEQGLGAATLTAQTVEQFVALRRAAGYSVYCSAAGLAPLVDYLDGLGVVASPPPRAMSPVEALLQRYRDYLVDERGVAAASARLYVNAVSGFVAGRVVGDRLALQPLSAKEVTAFVLETCTPQQPGKAKTTVTALRSLLRFLHAEGLTDHSLVGAVPSVAQWRLAALPRTVEPGDIRRLLAACDRRTAAGRRDAAMLLLLVRLGLRAGEVAALKLDDIDWRAGELVVRGKGNRRHRLPLPVEVGEALVGYLRRGRPATAAGRQVFVRLKAPHQGLSSEAVSERVCAAGRRAGIGAVRAHRLRHAAASGLLAAGAPLAEVSQLLGHQKASTTAIYAKVDGAALAVLARPWPAGMA